MSSKQFLISSPRKRSLSSLRSFPGQPIFWLRLWQWPDGTPMMPLRNIHTQLSDLVKEHVPEEQTGAFFNTISQVTCSFRQEMDNMATNQVFLPSQIIPNLWGFHRGLLEGLSLLGPPSCSASWPASLVERVTAVPAPQYVPGSSKTPTKSNPPPSGVVKGTLDSGKRSHQSAKQVARLFWGDPERGKEDAEARKQEEKH